MKIALFIPELFLLLASLVTFFLTLGEDEGRRAKGFATLAAAVNLGLCVAALGAEGSLFFDAYRITFYSQLFKVLIAAGLCIVLFFGRDIKGIRAAVRSEYYLFLLLSTLGLIMLVSAAELLTLFVALELSSYSLYLMVAMRDEEGGCRIQMEAAVKYILFGVVATGFMLFGMSYLFGLTGTTYLDQLVTALQQIGPTPAAVVGVGMVLGGLFFKLGVVPFHFWLPDVYQGAANDTTAFIASVPKIGAVAILIRIAILAQPSGESLALALMICSVASMFYGNLIALVQKDIKRMLAFSGMAHGGYVLLGVITMKAEGFATSIYYIGGYMLMSLACFLVISKVSRRGENLEVSDLTGLYQRAPLLAFTLAVGMFGMAGIPPFVGFMGKFMLLFGALQEGYLTLVILAALNTAISIFYYLSVVRVSYCSDPEGRPAIEVDGLTRLVSVALVLVIIVMGVMPQQVLAVASRALQTIM